MDVKCIASDCIKGVTKSTGCRTEEAKKKKKINPGTGSFPGDSPGKNYLQK